MSDQPIDFTQRSIAIDIFRAIMMSLIISNTLIPCRNGRGLVYRT